MTPIACNPTPNQQYITELKAYQYASPGRPQHILSHNATADGQHTCIGVKFTNEMDEVGKHLVATFQDAHDHQRPLDIFNYILRNLLDPAERHLPLFLGNSTKGKLILSKLNYRHWCTEPASSLLCAHKFLDIVREALWKETYKKRK